MKIVTLVENTPGGEGCVFEHGLSFYIQTDTQKILLDTGASEAFLQNAQRLGIDLAQVDMMVLSHGHYDHAGGILAFVKANSKAPIYMRPTAVKAYYNDRPTGAKYIGMDQRIFTLDRIIFTEEVHVLSDQISLFSGVTGRRLWPEGNRQLKCLENGEYTQDIFDHEQSLVIREQDRSVLISGCAHNGILNILDKYQELYGAAPDMVITGFHMKKNAPLTEAEKEIVKSTARELITYQNTSFYSGHCTGEEAFGIMKEIMGEQLHALHSGERIL